MYSKEDFKMRMIFFYSNVQLKSIDDDPQYLDIVLLYREHNLHYYNRYFSLLDISSSWIPSQCGWSEIGIIE
jgi:hypothetical protein